MTYEAELREAHKARRARFIAAGRARIASFRPVEFIPAFLPVREESPECPKTVPVLDFYDRVWTALEKCPKPTIPGRKSQMATILRTVCIFYDVPKNAIISHRRNARIVRPRQICMHLCKTRTIASFPEIGQFLGNRDHTTVLYGAGKISEQIMIDSELAHDVAWIERFLDGEAP